MELWDLYDADRQPLHRTHQRGKKKIPGEFNIVVGIWTVNTRGEILLTQRAAEKKSYPLKWENTGGSVLAGETSRQGAVRELWEETGIRAAEDELTLLGTCIETDAFVDVYFLLRDIPEGAITLQPGETIDARWVTPDELSAMIDKESVALPVARRLAALRPAFDAQLRALL